MIIPKKAFGLLVFVILASSLILFSRSVGHWLVETMFRPHGPIAPYTTHLVLLQFKDSTSPFAIKEITSKFFGLKKACLHPSTRRPYIVSISGGRDISIEKLQNGMSHAFVLQFYSNEDRDYYVDDDPIHKAFKDATGTILEKTLVVDFQDGVFTNAV